MKTPSCLRCNAAPALYLESLGELTLEHRFFCSVECAAEYGVMQAYCHEFRWCTWCEKWVKAPAGVCYVCKQDRHTARSNAATQGRG